MRVRTLLPSLDFSHLRADAELYVEDQHDRHLEARKRGIFFMLSAADHIVAEERLSEHGLMARLTAMFGFRPSYGEAFTRDLIGNDPAGHVFKRGPKGILVRHEGGFGKLLKW